MTTSIHCDLWRFGTCAAAMIMVVMAGACRSSDLQPTQPTPVANQVTGTLAENPGAPASARGFFPLALGNAWLYFGQSTLYLEGDSVVQAELYRERHELSGTENLFGRTYIVETQTHWSRFYPDPPPGSNQNWIRYRQDRAGLYEADVFSSQPPGDSARSRTAAPTGASADTDAWSGVLNDVDFSHRIARQEAYRQGLYSLLRKLTAVREVMRAGSSRAPHRFGPPGGVRPEELTRLAYPLFPGRSWVIRAEPRFEARTLAQEVLDLPAGRLHGFRIEITSEYFGDSDTVLVWYGREGLLRFQSHVESIVTDELGEPVGKWLWDEQMLLESCEL